MSVNEVECIVVGDVQAMVGNKSYAITEQTDNCCHLGRYRD